MSEFVKTKKEGLDIKINARLVETKKVGLNINIKM